MKNKTPAFGAEVLCKALGSHLHSSLTPPTYRVQRASTRHAFAAAAASKVVGRKVCAIFPKSGFMDCPDELGETGND